MSAQLFTSFLMTLRDYDQEIKFAQEKMNELDKLGSKNYSELKYSTYLNYELKQREGRAAMLYSFRCLAPDYVICEENGRYVIRRLYGEQVAFL